MFQILLIVVGRRYLRVGLVFSVSQYTCHPALPAVQTSKTHVSYLFVIMSTVKRKGKHRKPIEERSSSESNTASSSSEKPLFSVKRLAGRTLCIGLIVALVYFSSQKQQVKAFVKWDETVKRRSFRVECSTDYDEEKTDMQACIPKICGRVVTDTLLTSKEAQHLLRIAKRGLALGGGSGGASILDLHSGAISKDDEFVNIFKLPEGHTIFSEEDYTVYRNVKNKIHHMMAMEFGAQPSELYLTHPTFFSHMTPKPAKTQHDEYWHPHVDKETYKSFHYTSLVYLATYSQDFSGGNFVFVDREVNITIEPKIGRVSMFTSGSENLHYVEKVTNGDRYALTVSFTCNKKYAISDVTGKT